MKKSDAYRLAQHSVLSDDLIESIDKLEILRVLMEAEDVAKYSEKALAEKENEA